MRHRFLALTLFGSFALTMLFAGTPAMAACKKLGFTVNHYGKVGPTRDSKRLLDTYIASWTKKYGIKKYRKSKKTVTCYQFLDFGFFDEWTCKAVSNVCFRGRLPKGVTASTKTKTKKNIKKASRKKKHRKKVAKN